ncbi:MAG: hypothetical protein ABJB02_10915 [Dokdonella sp.]
MSLIAELKRRNVIRSAGLYLVGAWLVVQVAGTILPMFGAVDWIARSIVIALAIGFIPAMVVAWVFELTPAGLKRDEDVKTEDSIASQTAHRMNQWLLVVSIVAIGYFAFDKFVLAPRRDAALVMQTTAHVAAQIGAEKPNVSPKSIAVLAFTDLSPGHDQEYFSDGMSEEILNALAKVKDLKVAGRTSSFYYKGRNEDLRVVGKALGVANVLEGSVRTQNSKVRITAQLIRTDDDFHLWSDSYDGDLNDVFALQERIARAITDQLQAVLQGEQKTLLVPIATSSPEAYKLYLQATAIFNRRDGVHFHDAIAGLKQAIELDPKFARAHSRLAALYDVVPQYSADTDLRAALEAVQQYARSAIALDPTLAEAYSALGLSYRVQHRYIEEHAAYEHALALDPNDVTTNFWYGLSELMDGYTRHGMQLLDRTLTIDPMLPNALRWRAKMELSAGDLAGAQRNAQRARDLGLQVVDMNLAEIAHARGDNTNAIERWAAGMRGYLQGMPEGSETIIAEGLYGDDAARTRAIALIDAYVAQARDQINWVAPYVMVQLGEPAKALATMRTSRTNNDADFFALLWTPQGRAMRTSPVFNAFSRAVGLTQLWDKIGPPDLCKKSDAGDYTCE